MDVFTLSAKLILNTNDFNTKLDASEKKINGTSVAIGNLASQLVTRGFSAITKFGKSVVETGSDFEAMMSEVKALRTDATEEQFGALSKKAQELGASTKFTATEVASAFKYMALAGWTTDEMLAGIDGVLSLSAASGENLARTSDIVTDALTALGYEAKDTQEFVDALAAASANSNTTVGMMGEAFKYLATTGGVLGYSIEDVAITLGLLANNGIKASQAGTSMRQILNTLIAPTDKAAAAMQSLGISLFEGGTDKAKPLLQVISELREVFKNADFDLGGKPIEEIQSQLDEVNAWYDDLQAKIEANGGQADYLGKSITQKDLAKMYTQKLQEITHFNEDFLGKLSDIGGLRGISSLLALAKSTDEDFNQVVNAVYNSNGAAQTMAETMLANLKGDITILNSAIDGLKILVSEDFTSSFRNFVKEITEGVGKISEGFKQGGLVGMFTNLATWVIDGITGALSDNSITGEGVNKFAKAIGDFVGSTISKLVSSAPELISGLFQAGVSLADGLIQGLFSGLFGTGSGTVPGMITNIAGAEQDAIDAANETATKATGILGYMDSLQEKYGDAAKNTKEWATALDDLKKVFPEINTFIQKEGSELSLTNKELVDYIENSRQTAIEDAKRAAMQGYTEAYTKAVQDQGIAEIKRDLAASQASEAWQGLVDIVAKSEPGFTGKGKSIEQLSTAAYATVNELGNELGISAETVSNLVKIYNEQTKQSSEYASQVDSLTQSAVLLKSEMDIANRALANLAAEANSFSAPSYTTYGEYANAYYSQHHNAKGNYDVPYDNYPALLHRNEMVLTASQARQYREGARNTNVGNLVPAIVGAIREAMQGVSVNAYLNGRRVTDEVNRMQGNDLMAGRFATT